MDITLTFDDAYAEPAMACIESLIHHHPHRPPTFWLVTHELSPETRRDLERLVEGRARIAFLDATTFDVGSLPLSTHAHSLHVSAAGYLRLFAPLLVPAHVGRVLYLDVDTLCLGPLDDLVDVDLGGHTVAAVRDPYVHRMSDMEALPGLEEQHDVISPMDEHFNSGMMLIDTARWRERRVTPKACDYSRQHAERTRYPDQDALNAALHGSWLRVHHRWNHAMSSRLESRLGGRRDDARIVHFIFPVKPWHDSYPEGDRKTWFRRHLAAARRAVARSAAGSGTGADPVQGLAPLTSTHSEALSCTSS